MLTESAEFGKAEARKELHDIAQWWLEKSIDERHGGFVGEIDYEGRTVEDANKGIILNSRILWFFSELCLFDDQPAYREAAGRAFRYLADRFHDREHGGVFWELAADGAVISDKKQIYALCFSIYALTTYYRLTDNPAALQFSLDYFDAIETHARDREIGGYHEAFSREWQALADVRLSEKDMNAPKTMNTHLHLLEAYTALYQVSPSERTREALRNIVDLFCEVFIDGQSGHLRLFFDTDWNSLSTVVSYGHDIETSWLLWEAAETLGNAELLARIRPLVLHMADVCLREGLAKTGHLCDEYDPESGTLSQDSVWWVQTEAMTGFLNAFLLSGEQRFRHACEGVWKYVRANHIDSVGGEWHWLANADLAEIRSNYKAGFWKSPYHNGRAMMKTSALFEALDET